ncbi:MAG: hypothetical protein CMJ83_08555 [Planctomycetes bacterium]|nr:hypothetical protein [Planctomycetota bacterium]
MDLRGQDLRGKKLDEIVENGNDLHGSDLREASLRGADLVHVDLRGCDLRGADLSAATHMVLSELVAYEDGEWVALAAWDRHTQFPEHFEEKLWVLGLRYPGYAQEPGHKRMAMKRGLDDVADKPIDKEHDNWTEVLPGSSRDG